MYLINAIPFFLDAQNTWKLMACVCLVVELRSIEAWRDLSFSP